jgi:hypothetical protein
MASLSGGAAIAYREVPIGPRNPVFEKRDELMKKKKRDK